MRTLRGRTAIVTGASRGIICSIAHRLAAHQMRLVLAVRVAADLEAVAVGLRHAGSEVVVAPTDLRDPGARQELMPRVCRRDRDVPAVHAETGVELPAGVCTVAPQQVARALQRAIARDLPEVYVNALPVRPLICSGSIGESRDFHQDWRSAGYDEV